MLALHDYSNAHASVLFWDITHETFSITVRESVGHVVGGNGIIWKAGRGEGKVHHGQSGTYWDFIHLSVNWQRIQYILYFE